MIDPIHLEIYWSRAVAIANEMMETLIRTAFSTVIRINRDCSAAIFDETGRMLAQPDHSAPGHIGCMPVVMQSILEEFPVDTIADGDVFITNDPWIGAGHSPDIYIASPVFLQNRLIGFTVTVGHHLDIGGRVGPTDSQDLFEEGLLIPLMRMYRAGEKNADLFQIIEANVRLPHMLFGDFDAQLASNSIGAARLIELAEDYRLDGFAAIATAISAATEKSMRAAIQALPNGTYSFEQPLELTDEDGRPIVIKATFEVRDDEIEFDYEGTSAQVRRPINSVMNYTRSYTVLGFKMTLVPELPYNEGTQRPIKVRAPEGCVLNPVKPAPVWRRAVLGMQLPDIVFLALAHVLPEKIIAGSGSTPMWLWLFSGWRPDRRRFVFQTHFMGGLGARFASDGLHTAAFPFNMTDTPVEIAENVCPVLFHKRALTIDSGGPGRYRGGLGQEVVLSPAPARLGHIDGPLTASYSAGHLTTSAEGVGGGGAGAVGEISVNDETMPASLGTFRVRESDRLTIRLPGGGGYHDPLVRDPEAVRGDILDGFVSAEAARAVYGVVLSEPACTVDAGKTAALRAALHARDMAAVD